MDAVLHNITLKSANFRIPDGEYEGIWGGYGVEFRTDVGIFAARCNMGVRGNAVPCVVSVIDGKFSVRVKKE
ncbi:hypothetical protein VN12_19675 [Pirellula sp. SH-Sr6A]|nr:hypothetical protein VN12_02130 [Pirellula sp. SH-Sr6A]AMV31306.1 hypothetical protein VN12_04260 [Pirellula sp. SH-Sr6A]AMV34355.1 hypothetical protein VN12_19675 [Pirellula sp. SH-Sr6A]